MMQCMAGHGAVATLSLPRQAAPRPALRPAAPGREAPWNHPISKPWLWRTSGRDAMNVMPLTLSPSWRIALMSDGSLTRHLRLMTGKDVDVDCLDQVDLGEDEFGLPESAVLIHGPRVQRQVNLSVQGKPLVFATSWWSSAKISKHLPSKGMPIWTNLAAKKTELYREINHVHCGFSPFLERKFGHPGPFWAREYTFWHRGEPLAVIHESYSPALNEYLGPMYTVESYDMKEQFA